MWGRRLLLGPAGERVFERGQAATLLETMFGDAATVALLHAGENVTHGLRQHTTVVCGQLSAMGARTVFDALVRHATVEELGAFVHTRCPHDRVILALGQDRPAL